MHKKWRYEDTLCVGCIKNEESGDEILTCNGFDKGKNINENGRTKFSFFFEKSAGNMILAAKILKRKLKIRQKILEGVT